MQIRADSLVVLDSQKVGKPLPIVEAWKNSTHVMLIFPDSVYSRLGVKVGNVGGMLGATIWATLHPKQNYWTVYIPKSAFKVAGETAYKVVALDLKGSRHVCGNGVLRVYNGLVDDTADDAGNTDATSEAFIQHNGTWYAMEVKTDESGSLCLELKSAVEPPETEAQGTPYAYCKRTGLFHAVSVYEDETGALAVSLSDVGVEGEFASFAYDKATGLYYRLECENDGSGDYSIQIGEGQ